MQGAVSGLVLSAWASVHCLLRTYLGYYLLLLLLTTHLPGQDEPHEQGRQPEEAKADPCRKEYFVEHLPQGGYSVRCTR